MGVIIDFWHKANEVRFYIGNGKSGYHGDDWDTHPYECNASEVYREYIDHIVDVAFPFDWFVLEPCDGVTNSQYSKNDFKNRKIPCIIGVPPEVHENSCAYDYSYLHWYGQSDITRIYYGDPEELLESIPSITNCTTATWIPRSPENRHLGAKCSHCLKPQKVTGLQRLPNYCGNCGCKMTNGGISRTDWLYKEEKL